MQFVINTWQSTTPAPLWWALELQRELDIIKTLFNKYIPGLPPLLLLVLFFLLLLLLLRLSRQLGQGLQAAERVTAGGGAHQADLNRAEKRKM